MDFIDIERAVGLLERANAVLLKELPTLDPKEVERRLRLYERMHELVHSKMAALEQRIIDADR